MVFYACTWWAPASHTTFILMWDFCMKVFTLGETHTKILYHRKLSIYIQGDQSSGDVPHPHFYIDYPS